MNKDFRNVILIFAIVICGFSIHKFYISVTQVKYSEKDKSIQVTIKLFADDIVETINNINNTNLDVGIEDEKLQISSLINNYIQRNFEIEIDGMRKTISFIGDENDTESVWVYYEVSNILTTPKSIQVKNTILFDYYSSQRNNINFNIAGNKKTTVLIKSKPRDTVIFN